MSEQEFPYVVASGTPFELGQQHGRAAREIIHRFVEFNLRGAEGPGKPGRSELLQRVHFFEPLFREHCPSLLEEVRGLAEGAELSYEEALLLQIRGEIHHVPEGACTAYAISGRGTASGQLLIGQNSDVPPEMETFGIVLHLKPAGQVEHPTRGRTPSSAQRRRLRGDPIRACKDGIERGPLSEQAEILMWTFAGLLGYHGMNGHGVAHFANALAGGPAWQRGLPHYPLKRLFYEGRTIQDSLALLDRYPVCSSANYVMSGGSERVPPQAPLLRRGGCSTAGGQILDVESTPAGYATLDDAGEGFIVHSNHFLSPKYATPETAAQSLPDSCNRYLRMRELIRSEFGHLTVEHVQRFLADHDGHPTSICRHPSEGDRVGKSAASLIAEPQAGRFHVCRGNPCEGRWRTYDLRVSG